jgi:flagellar basal body-associated protein FliL
MQESVLIEWLNDNVGAVQATTTIILVAITAYYAWQTKRNVQLLEKTEEETRRPHIAVYITQREEWFNIIDLIIGNYGSGIARDILFKIDNDLELLNKNE